MGNLELNSELHLPAENRFIGGLTILHFFHSAKKQNKKKPPQSCGLKLMQDYKIQLKTFNDLYVCASHKLEN